MGCPNQLERMSKCHNCSFFATLVLSYHQQQSGLHGDVLIALADEEVIMSTLFPSSFHFPYFLQLLVAIVVLSYEWQAGLLVRMSRLAGG